MRDFMDAVARAGIRAGEHGPQIPRDATQSGIILCVPGGGPTLSLG